MRGRQRRSRAQRGQRQNPPLANATPPAPTAPISLIPTDLCAPNLIQSSYANFNRATQSFGAPLLTQTEPETTPAALAVDALVHLTEGWRFLSASLSSVLSNAPAQAIHFAYYAELRAAISLLSSHGMRVSNRNNSYLEQGGVSKVPTWQRSPTHKVVWELWEAWATTSSADALLLTQLKVLPSVTIGHLKASVGRVATNRTLTRWALDLSMGNEHLARNEASYETPTARASLQPMKASDFEFVRDLWALAEPTGFGLRFEQELVRYLIDTELNDAVGEDAGARALWRRRLVDDLERTTGTPRETLEAFFKEESSPSPIFDLAFDTDIKPLNMIARAFFLLRVANLVPNAAMLAHPETMAKGWLKDWLTHAGLYNPSDGVEPNEKWIDFEHLSAIEVPPMPLPIHLHSTPTRSVDTHLLSRADAMLAWSTSL